MQELFRVETAEFKTLGTMSANVFATKPAKELNEGKHK